MRTMTHSIFGLLLNGTTADLVARHASYKRQIAEIDAPGQRASAMVRECELNDRRDMVRRCEDLGAEICARLNNPVLSYAVIGVIRRDMVETCSSPWGASILAIYAEHSPLASGERTPSTFRAVA